MEIDFQKQEGTGISKLINFVSAEAQEIITKLLIYDHNGRMSCGQALRYPYFKELRDADKSLPDN